MLTRIINGKLWIKGKIVEKDIVIEDSRIKDVIKKTENIDVDKVVDAGGSLVLPGLIDSHAHLRDGAQAYKEDFVSGTSSAVAGGFTLVMDMPNNVPLISTPQHLIERKNYANQRILCDVGFHGMPTQRENILPLEKAGCIGYKIYTHKIFEDSDFSIIQNLISLFEKVKETRLPLSIHAEDPKKLGKLDTSYDAEEHAKAHPREAEYSMINSIIQLAQTFPVKTRLCHITTSESIIALVRAKEYNSNLYAEATPSHLVLDNTIFKECKKICTLEPPFREPSDTIFLRNALWNGIIDIIGTDHAPHALSEKLSDKPISGFPAFETAIPVLFTLVKKGFLPLSNTIQSLTTKPAKFFSLKEYGSIEKDKVANLTFTKFVSEYTIDPLKFYSKAKFSPFEGFKAEAAVERTIIRGETVYTRKDGVFDIRKGKVVEG